MFFLYVFIAFSLTWPWDQPAFIHPVPPATLFTEILVCKISLAARVVAAVLQLLNIALLYLFEELIGTDQESVHIVDNLKKFFFFYMSLDRA